jgi:hypothetical protein
LDEARPAREIGAVVDSDGGVGECRDGITFQKMIKDSVGIIGDVWRLEVMMILTEDVIDSGLDLQRVETFINLKIHLASFIWPPTRNLPSGLETIDYVQLSPDVLKYIRTRVFLKGAWQRDVNEVQWLSGRRWDNL